MNENYNSKVKQISISETSQKSERSDQSVRDRSIVSGDCHSNPDPVMSNELYCRIFKVQQGSPRAPLLPLTRDSGNNFRIPDFASHTVCFRLIFVRISSVVSFWVDIQLLCEVLLSIYTAHLSCFISLVGTVSTILTSKNTDF